MTGPGYAAGPGGGGAPDPSFGGDGVVDLPAMTISTPAESHIQGVAEAPDGSIRVVWDDDSGHVSKYSSTGVLDPSFGTDGHVQPGVAIGSRPPVIDADGATFVTQADVDAVLKLDAAGNPDPAFGLSGLAPVPGLGSDSAIELRSDGGVIVTAGGDLTALSADGTPDPGFTYDTDVYAAEVAVLADDRIAVAATTLDDLVVLDPDGSPAVGIGSDLTKPGVLDIDVSPFWDRVASVAPGPNGGVLALVGFAELSDEDGLFAVMFNAAGIRDVSFGEDGVVDLTQLTDNPSLSIFDVERPLVDHAGRAVISLPALVRKPEVLRLDPTGHLDTTFGDEGRRLVPTRTYAPPVEMALAAGDSLYLVSPQTLDVGWVARLAPDGSDDVAFDEDGFLFPGPATNQVVTSSEMATQSDGSVIVLQGTIRQNRPARQELIRLTSSGSRDLSFGTAGRASLVSREDAGDLVHLAVDELDRIYATHQRSPDVWVVSRWLSDGTPDGTWGDDGQALLPFIEAVYAFWFDASPLADGSLMVAGAAIWPLSCCGDQGIVTAVHLAPDGTLDASYDSPRLALADDASGALTFLADGSTIIGVGTALHRFTPSGLPDPSWHAGPVGGGGGCRIALLAPGRRGGVHVATLKECSTDDVPVLYALDAHGHPDPLIPDPAPLDLPIGSNLRSMVVDATGRIVLGVSGTGPAVVRLLANGTPDPSFSTTIGSGDSAVDGGGRVLVWANPTDADRRITRLLAGAPPAPLPISLQAHPITINGTYVTATGDFNADGTEDILWYAPGTAADSIWYGRHSGGFTMPSVTINGRYQPVAGDFDGDGRTDILFYGSGSDPDVLWRSKSGGGFASSTIAIAGSYRPIAGDFNGDGRSDIVWYVPGTAADFLWSGRADGGFTSSPLTINGTYQPVPGDYSGDGLTDIVFYGAGVAPDVLWSAKPTGGFSSASITVNGTYRPAGGDLNGDGLDDIVWHGPGASSDVLWLARRGGGFTSQAITVNGRYLPVVADVTGDGLADLLWYAPGAAHDYLAPSMIRR